MGIKEEIQESFREGTMLTKIIYINLGVYVVVGLALVFFQLFELNIRWLNYLMLPSNLHSLLSAPWTPFTYMFLHTGFIHLLMNILMLYWFGKLFLEYCMPKDLMGVYVLGGLAGALLYLLAFNLLPYFRPVANHSFLLGASASIMAIVVAVATIAPNRPIHLAFIGDIRIKWLAIASVLISTLGITSTNAGGEISHIGGAIAGYIFALQFQKGKNITNTINKVIDRITNLFRKRPTIRVAQTRTETDWEYNQRKKQENANIDRILDKIRQYGYDSLTQDEKKQLFGNNK